MKKFIYLLVMLYACPLNLCAQLPVAHWKLNGSANNETGNYFNGILHRNPMPTTNRFQDPNNAYFFNRTGNMIRLGDILDTLFTKANSKFTVSGWAKTSTLPAYPGGNMIVSKSQGSYGPYQWYVNHDIDGRVKALVSFNQSGSVYIEKNSVAQVDTGVWFHFALVFNGTASDSNKVKLYVNGIQGSTIRRQGTAFTTSTVNTNQEMTIGGGYSPIENPKDSISNQFHGSVDDIKIFNYALSVYDIDKLLWEAPSCKDTTSHDSIGVNPFPPLHDLFICRGDSVSLKAPGGSNVSWTPASGLSNPGIENTIAQPDTTTTYILAMTVNNKRVFDTVVVYVNQNCCINQDTANASLIFAVPVIGNAVDVTANPVSYTISGNSVSLTNDRFSNNNGAYDFANATNRIVYDFNSKLSFPQNQSFSISAWVNVRSVRANPNFIFSIFQNGGFETFIGGTNSTHSGKLCFQDFNGPSLSVRSLIVSPNSFPLNSWNLVTITLNATDSTNTLYLNGNRIAQVKAVNSTLLNAGIVLGNHISNTWGLDGKIDDARIYGRALDSLEVRALFNNRKITILNQDTTIYRGDSIAVKAVNTVAASYSWTPTSGVSNPTIPNPILKPTQSTTYILQAISINGCISADTIVITVDSGMVSRVNQFSAFEKSIAIYPNPAKDHVTINHVAYPNVTVKFMNLLGQVVFEKMVDNEASSNIELPDMMPSGTYVLQCINSENQELLATQKLLIE